MTTPRYIPQYNYNYNYTTPTACHQNSSYICPQCLGPSSTRSCSNPSAPTYSKFEHYTYDTTTSAYPTRARSTTTMDSSPFGSSEGPERFAPQVAMPTYLTLTPDAGHGEVAHRQSVLREAGMTYQMKRFLGTESGVRNYDEGAGLHDHGYGYTTARVRDGGGSGSGGDNVYGHAGGGDANNARAHGRGSGGRTSGSRSRKEKRFLKQGVEMGLTSKGEGKGKGKGKWSQEVGQGSGGKRSWHSSLEETCEEGVRDWPGANAFTEVGSWMAGDEEDDKVGFGDIYMNGYIEV